MSVLTSPRGKSEVVHCRRTESQDIYCIKSLMRKFTQKLFGKLNVIYLLEKANLAVTLCNDKEEIMAQATFVDYPNWNVSKQDAWVSLFRELDSEIPCTPLNTLFMHLFVAVDEYSTGCCREIIRTVFKAVPELHFIFLIVPAYMSLGSTLITVFTQVGSIPCLTFEEDFAVYICHRHSHYPQLHIRKARVDVPRKGVKDALTRCLAPGHLCITSTLGTRRHRAKCNRKAGLSSVSKFLRVVSPDLLNPPLPISKHLSVLERMEDHDDLMPIFMHHDTILKETYGEYFLAELIEAQDEENHSVVCEEKQEQQQNFEVCSKT